MYLCNNLEAFYKRQYCTIYLHRNTHTLTRMDIEMKQFVTTRHQFTLIIKLCLIETRVTIQGTVSKYFRIVIVCIILIKVTRKTQ